MPDNVSFEGALMKLLDSAKSKDRPEPATEKVRPSGRFPHHAKASDQGITINNSSFQHVQGNSYIINISSDIDPAQIKAILQSVLSADHPSTPDQAETSDNDRIPPPFCVSWKKSK